jgi:hypothetical protein
VLIKWDLGFISNLFEDMLYLFSEDNNHALNVLIFELFLFN